MEDYQPRFSRNSLNWLMFITLGLIVLFNLPAILAKQDAAHLPKPSLIPITQWQTDSGAQVWFSPHTEEQLQLQLWYRAGYQFDAPAAASLLAQLIKWQSRNYGLQSKVSLDQDFIKLSVTLSNHPPTLNQQIQYLRQLLYEPDLPRIAIEQLRTKPMTLASDALRHQLYGKHGYGSQIDTDQLKTLSQQDIRAYQRAYMHPKRLHVALVADLDIPSARVLVERILPISTHRSAQHDTAPTLAINGVQTDSRLLLNWPKLLDNQTDLDMVASVALLKVQFGELVKWRPGLSNSVFQFQISKGDLTTNVLQGDWDSDMMLATKRQLALKWIRQTHSADTLSRHLVALNAYGLPQDYMRKQIVRLEEFDQQQWQHALKTLLAPAVSDNS